MRTDFALCDDLGRNLSRVSHTVPVGRVAVPIRGDAVAVGRDAIAIRVIPVQRHMTIGRGHMTI